MSSQEIIDHLKSLGDSARAEHSQRFFKTGKGEYAEGDIFLGIRVPVIRDAVKKFKDTPLSVAEQLLKSEYHEVRLFALILLVTHMKKPENQEEIYQIYLRNSEYINNWDLVDTSAPHIVGKYLEDRDCKVLYELAKSDSLWERRIAMLATQHFIRKRQFEDALKISEILLHDDEDLIHKAVGWMLREIGKRDKSVEVEFLERYYQEMPRTMLRYAIEKFDENERQRYLTK